ncbi:lytic transglycosylase domain-containing protein [Bounagaea algeriensis]
MRGRAVVAVALVVLVSGGIGLLDVLTRPPEGPRAGPLPREPVRPAAVEPGSEAPAPDESAGPESLPPPAEGAWQQHDDPVRALAEDVAAEVDIPARAAEAYVNAELGMRRHRPECGLSWVTVAGIGRVESDHGRYGDRVLGEDGTSTTPIIGVPLDGGPGVRHLPDSDGGALDGDTRFDRAVGPLQFIPGTWRSWGADGNGDGVADPFDIDDAAMSAARYLCSGGRDMTTGRGWWSGVLTYNNSADYGRTVFSLAESYAAAGSRHE